MLRKYLVPASYFLFSLTANQITIEPEAARAAGARWKLTGSDTWRQSGESVSIWLPQNLAVEFADLIDWLKPAEISQFVGTGQAVSVTGTYQLRNITARVLNWAEMILPETLPQEGKQAHNVGKLYFRYYPVTEIYLGSLEGRLLYYHPSSGSEVIDLGALVQWLLQAEMAGF